MWKELEYKEAPGWVKDAAASEFPMANAGRNGATLTKIFHGNTFVYKVEATYNKRIEWSYYRQLKSQYFTTDHESGTCPHCQAYVRRYEGDDYLTCHRCGWQYKPISARLKNLVFRLVS